MDNQSVKKPLRKLQEEIKDMKAKAKVHLIEQTNKLKKLEDKVKDHLAYKQLILSAVKSNYRPENIVSGLKVVAKHIKAKNWSMVDRIGGPSGDLDARGACPICHINLTGKDLRPREITFPCGVTGCPFEKHAN